MENNLFVRIAAGFLLFQIVLSLNTRINIISNNQKDLFKLFYKETRIFLYNIVDGQFSRKSLS